jgi:tetratricopeptide (TPR) repeat protein
MKTDALSTAEKERNAKAYDHYFQGSLLDFQDEFEKALLQYYQALLYDSSSAQIHKAIARDQIRLQNFESALIHLEKSHSLNSQDRETLNYLAEVHYNLNHFQKSIDYYNQLLQIDPYNSSVQNNLIFLYSHLKMEDDLLNFYKKMMAYYPNDNKFAVQYALSNIKQRNIPEAQKILEEVVREDSTQINALMVLGNLYEVQKDTAQAVKTYKNILSLDPQNEDVLNRIYRILRSQGNWEEIENVYNSILESQPENTQVRLILAETYYFQEKNEAARSVLEPVLSDDTYRFAAFELLGRIAFDREDFEQAEKYFTSLTEETPQNRFSWLFLAIIYNRQNQFQQSLTVLERSLNIHQNDVDLLAMYGSTLSQVGRDREAIPPLEKALALNRENTATITSIAAVYDKLEMWDKSDSLYEEILQKNPRNALLLNNYSYSLAQRNLQLERALEMVDMALQVEPDNGAYLDTKGWIYYKMGRYEEARQYIQKALDSREDSAEVLEHMGDIYYQLGKLEEAKNYWERALEKDPQNIELAQKIQDL